MRTLYLDCGMGAAGDMLMAALYELLDEEEQRVFLERMNHLGLEGVVISPERVAKCGIWGTHMAVQIHGEEEHVHEHTHEHSHEHHHEHTHYHSSMADIAHITEHMNLSEHVKEHIRAVYELIAQAESAAHNKPVSEIHFHEVGNLDAIADITGVCLLMEMLKADRVEASPVHVGAGHVHCAHGTLPVPAPATAYILRDVPIYGGEVMGELCTPTGAALLVHFADSFGNMPVVKVKKTGYGMGKKDFSRVNCVRAFLAEAAKEEGSETVLELSCNVDDMTPEYIGFALERFLEAGALEAFTVAAGMKKSRPGVLIYVMCYENKREELLELIFRHTTTLGVRESIKKRYIMERSVEEVQTPYGTIHKKNSEGYGAMRSKYEYEELAKIAREQSMSLFEVAALLENE